MLDLIYTDEGNVESLWVELFPRTKRSLLLCCVYRPPSKVDFYDLFASECEKIMLHSAQSFRKVLILIRTHWTLLVDRLFYSTT